MDYYIQTESHTLIIMINNLCSMTPLSLEIPTSSAPDAEIPDKSVQKRTREQPGSGMAGKRSLRARAAAPAG